MSFAKQSNLYYIFPKKLLTNVEELLCLKAH